MQGKFWQVYDKLFETQTDWSSFNKIELSDFFQQMSEEIGFDHDQFQLDYNNPETISIINEDQAELKAVGVTELPTVFIYEGNLRPPQKNGKYIRT